MADIYAQVGNTRFNLESQGSRVVIATIPNGEKVITVPTNDSLDAFSRMRISSPQSIFDAQFTYDLHPLLFEQLVLGTGTSISFDSVNRCATISMSSSPTGTAYMQTYEHFRYQPGKSQLIFLTFNMFTPVNGVSKFAGYSDGSNGINLIYNASGTFVQILSTTQRGSEIVHQSNWNLDVMDGTGRSGIILDMTKVQILVIDFQALYVGRVRIGFDIDGEVHYVHEFLHANIDSYGYMASANLPIRVGMEGIGSATMNFICSSVVSEGGQEETVGYGFNAFGNVTAASGARTFLLAVRPKGTFNGRANRVKFILDSIDVLVTGNSPVFWELCVGQGMTGTAGAMAFTDVNSSYSSMEFNATGTISGNPVIVIDSGYVSASATVKSSQNVRVPLRYPITLNAAGNQRSLGTLSLIVTGIGGTTTTYGSLNWREVR